MCFAVDGVGFRAEDGQPPGPENLTIYNGSDRNKQAVFIFSGFHGGEQGPWLGSFTEVKARPH